MYQTHGEKWVCGTVERYNNEWGFRLKPKTIFTGEVTAEALQTWIEHVSTHMNYWLNSTACFSSKVIMVQYA